MGHGKSDMGACEDGSVIDAIAHHGYVVASRLQAPHQGQLAVGGTAALHCRHPQLATERLHDRSIVPRIQVHRNAFRLQSLYGLHRILSQALGKGKRRNPASLIGQMHPRMG